MTVVAGDLNLKDNSGSEQEQAVAEMIQHPGYDSKTMLNDIMLIRLYVSCVIKYFLPFCVNRDICQYYSA